MMENLVGQSVKGYDLIDRIGTGGFGVVYRAYQSTIGREVAIKVILPGYADHPEFIRRFEAEAQLIARLEHLHIVPLYDYWREPGGAYLVMRWLRGGSLKEAIGDGPFELAPAALLLDQVASALTIAHINQVIHRDLKPSNILLDEEGNAYLVDFGIAKDLGKFNGNPSRPEAVVGSPGYLSPEQARSEPVTPQTDIYSLGVTLFELLTGQHPFPGLSAVERVFKHINDPLPLIDALDPQVREDVNQVIQRATAKNPMARFPDVLAMAAAFRKATRLEDDGRPRELVEALTLREQEILHLIVEGYTNRQIAQELFVEVSTVKWHIRQIYTKLGVRSRRQAILLARELDLLVSDATRDTEAEPTDSRTIITAPITTNPYRGLRAFESPDRRYFFGREKLITRLISRLSGKDIGRMNEEPGEARFLAVVGPSGSGKSSLIKAGLVPALWEGAIPGSEDWFVVDISPGARPLDELEVGLVRIAAEQAGNIRAQLDRDAGGLLRAAELILPKDGSELVLVVDQFEELFTLVESEKQRNQFIDLLSAAVRDPHSRIRVILTLRADYYDRPLQHPVLGQLVRGCTETVLPLSAEELERAIALPAEALGVTFESGLVSKIIDDTLYQAGALPLLQYALTELFEQRKDHTLTHAAYQAIGGTAGALAKRAEELYQEHDRSGREAIRQMFLRLVALDPAGESVASVDTRRRAPRQDLALLAEDEDLIDEIIDGYTNYRLLTLDNDPATRRPTVEISHEALLREWDRLNRWLEDSLDGLYQHRRLEVLTQEWVQNQRNPGLLLRQARLDQFAAWSAETDLALTQDERAYLEASMAARQERSAAEGARRQRELETAQKLAETEARRAQESASANRRLRWLTVGLAILLAISAGAAFLAWQQSQRAERQARLATARELAAAAVSNLEVDPERSMLLALEAAETTYAFDQSVLPEAEEALHRAVTASRLVYRVPGTGAVAYSPDGRYLATSSEAGADIWDPATGDKRLTIRAEEVGALNLAFNLDGSRLATIHTDNTAGVWDAATGEMLLRVEAPAEGLISLAFDPLGRRLAASGRDGAVRVWDARSGQLVHTLPHPDLPVGLAFNPDGTRLAVAVDSSPGEAVVWDMASGGQSLVLTGHADGVNDVVFDSDGTRLATASTDGSAKVWDAVTGEALASMPHGAWVFGVDFSSDGSRIATGSQDGLAKVWDVESGREVVSLAGHNAGVDNVAFSPDGRRLASGSQDGMTRVWDITPEGSREWLTLAGHGDLVFGVAYDPDGERLASASWDGSAIVWDAGDGRPLLTLTGHADRVTHVAFDAQGQRLATASYDGTVKLWDANTGRVLNTLEGHGGWVYAVAFSPDGRRLATGGADGTLRLWDPATGEALRRLDAHEGFVFRVSYSPDGTKLATAGWDGTAKVWDPASGDLLLTLSGHEEGVHQAAFSADGTRLVTSSFDGTAKVWDIGSGQELVTLAGHTDTVWDVSFSPDGDLLATVGFEGLIKVWDAQSGDEKLTLFAQHLGPDLAFSPDGSRLAVAGGDGTVRVYILSIDELMALARSRLTRSLTDEECQRYLHLARCPASP